MNLAKLGMKKVVTLAVAAIFLVSLLVTALGPVVAQGSPSWLVLFNASCAQYNDEGICVLWVVG